MSGEGINLPREQKLRMDSGVLEALSTGSEHLVGDGN
jgi:hypothetical protein